MRAQSLPILRTVADGFGVAASALCAVHCLLVPTLLVAGTALPACLLSDELFHRALLWVILPSALVALGLGCWRHKDLWVFLLGAAGLLGMTLSVAVLHDLIGEAGERSVTLASAALLISAHARNFICCRSHDCEHG